MILFPWTPFVSAMKTILMVLLHWMALASVALAIYVVAGSWMFGEWWYGFFWGGKRNLQYITDGLRVLLDEHYRLAIATVAAILAAVVVSDAMLAHWLLPFTDSFGGLIVFTACMTILAAALVVRHTKGESYRRWQEIYRTLDAVRKLTSATTPKIEPPICFHYLDNERVEALYNQIQPELEERERIVGGSRTFGGEAKGRVGGVNIEVGAGKAKESKSTLTRIDFSTGRKCIEIMKHVQETRPGNYYSSAVDWYFRRATKEISLSAASPATAQAGRGKELASSEDSRRKVERWHGELKRELELLDGLVFVDGEFQPSVTNDSVTLIAKFLTSPFTASFRILLLKKALQALPTTTPLRLTVFGDVQKPLGDDGLVDIVAIAAY